MTKLDGVNEIERLWEKKQTSEQEKGHPVSDKLKKTVSDIFSSWRESLGEIDNEQEVMKTQIKLDKLRSANKMKIAYNKYNKERPKTGRNTAIPLLDRVPKKVEFPMQEITA